MKKSRILAFSLIVMVMLMGAGYAAWTDTLNINSSVVTGDLDVNFVQTPTAEFNSNNQDVAKVKTLTVNGNDATVELENLYPGAVVTVTLPVKNEGSIPVKDGNFVFTGQPNWLTVEATTQQPILAVDQTANVVFTATVGDGAPEETTATFTGTATYQQFNK